MNVTITKNSDRHNDYTFTGDGHPLPPVKAFSLHAEAGALERLVIEFCGVGPAVFTAEGVFEHGGQLYRLVTDVEADIQEAERRYLERQVALLTEKQQAAAEDVRDAAALKAEVERLRRTNAVMRAAEQTYAMALREIEADVKRFKANAEEQRTYGGVMARERATLLHRLDVLGDENKLLVGAYEEMRAERDEAQVDAAILVTAIEEIRTERDEAQAEITHLAGKVESAAASETIWRETIEVMRRDIETLREQRILIVARNTRHASAIAESLNLPRETRSNGRITVVTSGASLHGYRFDIVMLAGFNGSVAEVGRHYEWVKSDVRPRLRPNAVMVQL